LLRQAIDWPDPVLFVESKTGYADRLIAALAGYDLAEIADAAAPFPTATLLPRGRIDGLLMCYGGLTAMAVEAMTHLREREQLNFGLVAPAQLSPMPVSHLDAVLRDRDLAAIVTVEDGAPAAGWGAEMVASLSGLREAQGRPATRYRRVGASDSAIPSARDLEYEMLPQIRDVVAAALDCF
ncbi:unnamed protein product, partial [Phaeothamnion confervicola]